MEHLRGVLQSTAAAAASKPHLEPGREGKVATGSASSGPGHLRPPDGSCRPGTPTGRQCANTDGDSTSASVDLQDMVPGDAPPRSSQPERGPHPRGRQLQHSQRSCGSGSR